MRVKLLHIGLKYIILWTTKFNNSLVINEIEQKSANFIIYVGIKSGPYYRLLMNLHCVQIEIVYIRI